MFVKLFYLDFTWASNLAYSRMAVCTTNKKGRAAARPKMVKMFAKNMELKSRRGPV